MSDAVNHPDHYNQHPSGVECIAIVEHMGFNAGNAVKYLWRAGLKGGLEIQDLRKAAWYIEREILRLGAVPPGVELTPLGATKLPPGLTLAEDGSLLNWLGENYVRQADVQATQNGMIAEWERTQAGWDEAKDEVDKLRTNYEDACVTIAQMHAAAHGGQTRAPLRGVVEDVEDLRLAHDQAQSRLRAVLSERDALRANLRQAQREKDEILFDAEFRDGVRAAVRYADKQTIAWRTGPVSGRDETVARVHEGYSNRLRMLLRPTPTIVPDPDPESDSDVAVREGGV